MSRRPVFGVLPEGRHCGQAPGRPGLLQTARLHLGFFLFKEVASFWNLPSSFIPIKTNLFLADTRLSQILTLKGSAEESLRQGREEGEVGRRRRGVGRDMALPGTLPVT